VLSEESSHKTGLKNSTGTPPQDTRTEASSMTMSKSVSKLMLRAIRISIASNRVVSFFEHPLQPSHGVKERLKTAD
jgi:hypothetical protein